MELFRFGNYAFDLRWYPLTSDNLVIIGMLSLVIVPVSLYLFYLGFMFWRVRSTGGTLASWMKATNFSGFYVYPGKLSLAYLHKQNKNYDSVTYISPSKARIFAWFIFLCAVLALLFLVIEPTSI